MSGPAWPIMRCIAPPQHPARSQLSILIKYPICLLTCQPPLVGQHVRPEVALHLVAFSNTSHRKRDVFVLFNTSVTF